MGKVIRENNTTASYCNIKFEDGSSVLIGQAQTGILIKRLRFFGLIPTKTLFRISANDLFSEKYQACIDLLNKTSEEGDFLYVFRDYLLPCESLDEVKERLKEVQLDHCLER